jgi:hypothetical protein
MEDKTVNLTIKHSGTLRFWGEWFGRPMDNIHVVTEAQFNGERNKLTINFNDNEVCVIFDPENIVSTDTQFYILDAAKIVWQWYSYGHEQSSKNLATMEYEKIDSSNVVVKTKQGIKRINPAGFNAIEIC